MKDKKKSIKWKGVFNYRHSLHVLYSYAPSEKAAFIYFCKRLADKHLVDIGIVVNMFKDTDRYSIQIEKIRKKTDVQAPLS